MLGFACFAKYAALNEANIEYAVVGGIALSFHTQPRYTKDIDLFSKQDIADIEALENDENTESN